MIKVLHIMSAAANADGISTVVYNYYSNIDRSIINFDIALTTNSFGTNGERLQALGSKIYKLPLKSDGLSAFKKELKTILINNNYDAIHVHENETSYVALKVAKKCGVKTRIAHSHTSSPYNGINGEIRRISGCVLNYIYATHLIACGKLAGERVFGKLHMKSDKAIVLYNALDCTKYRFDCEYRKMIRSELGINDKFVIGQVGRLSSEKNQILTLQIMREYHKKNSNAILFLVGDGEDVQTLKRFVIENEMSSYVEFLGSRADVNKLYSIFDISLLTSIHEGFPVAGIESLVSGLPLILSDTITYELGKYQNVKYCPLNDITSWVETISRYSENVRMPSKDMALYKDFNIGQNVFKLEKIYLSNKST